MVKRGRVSLTWFARDFHEYLGDRYERGVGAVVGAPLPEFDDEPRTHSERVGKDVARELDYVAVDRLRAGLLDGSHGKRRRFVYQESVGCRGDYCYKIRVSDIAGNVGFSSTEYVTNLG